MQRVFKHDVYRPCRYGGWRCTSCDRFRGVLTAAVVHTGRLADGRMVSGWEPECGNGLFFKVVCSLFYGIRDWRFYV